MCFAKHSTAQTGFGAERSDVNSQRSRDTSGVTSGDPGETTAVLDQPAERDEETQSDSECVLKARLRGVASRCCEV